MITCSYRISMMFKKRRVADMLQTEEKMQINADKSSMMISTSRTCVKGASVNGLMELSLL